MVHQTQIFSQRKVGGYLKRQACYFFAACIIISDCLILLQYQKPIIFLDTKIIFSCVTATASHGLCLQTVVHKEFLKTL
jgi:hypothetical protein